MIIDVKPNIYNDSHPRKIPNSNSNCHYGYHCGGHPYGYACQTAEEIAKGLQEANNNPDPYCSKYDPIEIAIIPFPGSKDHFYLEDRSIRIR